MLVAVISHFDPANQFHHEVRPPGLTADVIARLFGASGFCARLGPGCNGRFFQEIADLIIFLKQGFNRATQLHVAATSAFQLHGALVSRQPKGFGEHRQFVICGTVHFTYENCRFAALANHSE
jgi:hypothetical protein